MLVLLVCGVVDGSGHLRGSMVVIMVVGMEL
jgi:hypothetical protein